jgi:hypothetical protein
VRTELVSEQAALPAAVIAELPLLGESFTPSRVAAVFAEAWGRDVTGGRPLSCRFEPGAGAVTTHALVVDGGPVLGALEVTPTRRRLWRCEDDPELPGLRIAADPDLMAERLRSVLGPIEGCAAEVWRYRPGERAVLRYDVAAAGGPVTLFGKVLRQGARDVACVIDALHRAGDSDPALPSVPALVAVFDDLGLIVQAAVQGDPLHRLAYDEAVLRQQRIAAFERTGAALAAMHGGGHGVGPSVSYDDDSAKVRTDMTVAERIVPKLGALLAGALIRTTAAAPTTGTPPFVSSHGALRTDQIVLVARRPTMLDLDGACLAEPARDAGNLLAYLRWRAIRQPSQARAVVEVRRAFLDGYGPVADEALARFEALTLLKIVGRRVRNLTVAEWPLLPGLVATADAVLQGGGG